MFAMYNNTKAIITTELAYLIFDNFSTPNKICTWFASILFLFNQFWVDKFDIFTQIIKPCIIVGTET